jgi:hypothetical protein
MSSQFLINEFLQKGLKEIVGLKSSLFRTTREL